ncbi:hypothetical protein SRB521_01462 [Intestinimonas butyriciproducens]|nr:hypothetical protein SRB521_01462 [Intestinimonas butyriciproducens]
MTFSIAYKLQIHMQTIWFFNPRLAGQRIIYLAQFFRKYS